MKTSELKRLLEEHGCRKVDEGSNHEKWFSPVNNRHFRVPRHQSQELKKGTAEGILKQAGLK